MTGPATCSRLRTRFSGRGIGSIDTTQQVLVALRRIIRATDLHSKRTARESGLTVPQIVVLKAVADLGEVSTGAVSAAVSLSPATVSTIVDRLERRALLRRYRNPTDRRVVHLTLTDAGHAVLATAPPLLHLRFVEAFEARRPADQRRILRALRDVAEMMGVEDVDAAPLLDVGAPTGPTDARSRTRRGERAGI